MSIDQSQSVSVHQLDAVLPKHWALHWRHVAVVAFFVVTFLGCSYLPVNDVTTWNAVQMGNAQWSSDQMLPLAQGMRFLNTGTLANVIIHQLYKIGGAELLSLGFAMAQLLTIIGWGVACKRISGRWWFLFAGSIIAFASTSIHGGLSGRTLGHMAFAGFAYWISLHWNPSSAATSLWRLQLSKANKTHLVAITTLFVLWANFDLSVLIGINLLICFVVARARKTVQTRGWKSLSMDKEFRSRVWILELAILATLISPAGIDLYRSLFWQAEHPLRIQFGGVTPMMNSRVGWTVLLTWAGLWFINRKRSLSAHIMLPLLGMTIAVAYSTQFVSWFLAVAVLAYATALRTSNPDDSSANGGGNTLRSSGPAHFGFSLSCVLVIWIGFCFSPWASVLLGGTSRTETQLLGDQMPRTAAVELNRHIKDGLLFCPVEWSDWVQHETGLSVFANAQFRRIPATAQKDYQKIYQGESNWRKLTEKYGLKAMLVNKQSQQQLIRRIRQDSSPWTIIFEDNQSLILAVQS